MKASIPDVSIMNVQRANNLGMSITSQLKYSSVVAEFVQKRDTIPFVKEPTPVSLVTDLPIQSCASHEDARISCQTDSSDGNMEKVQFISTVLNNNDNERLLEPLHTANEHVTHQSHSTENNSSFVNIFQNKFKPLDISRNSEAKKAVIISPLPVDPTFCSVDLDSDDDCKPKNILRCNSFSTQNILEDTYFQTSCSKQMEPLGWEGLDSSQKSPVLPPVGERTPDVDGEALQDYRMKICAMSLMILGILLVIAAVLLWFLVVPHG